MGVAAHHAGVLRQESWLRRSMWVLDAMQHPLAPAASGTHTLASFFLGDERTDSDCGSDCKRGAEDDVASAAPRESALKTCVTAYGPGEPPVGGFTAGMREVLSQLDHRKVGRTRSASEKVDRREDSHPALHACGECPASSCAVRSLVEGAIAQRVAAFSAQCAR